MDSTLSRRKKLRYFSDAYHSGYYDYLWTEVFFADAFSYLGKNGGLTREHGGSYRSNALSMGNSQNIMQDYINFRG